MKTKINCFFLFFLAFSCLGYLVHECLLLTLQRHLHVIFIYVHFYISYPNNGNMYCVCILGVRVLFIFSNWRFFFRSSEKTNLHTKCELNKLLFFSSPNIIQGKRENCTGFISNFEYRISSHILFLYSGHFKYLTVRNLSLKRQIENNNIKIQNIDKKKNEI